MLHILQITGFILWVNFLPPLASILLGGDFSKPLDGGKSWLDNKPIFGPHKTVRGIIASLLGGTLVFPFLGVTFWVAAIASLLTMAGDLLSSFIKRRLDLPSGKNVIVLDQFFESFFPLFLLTYYIQLSIIQAASILLLFILIAYIGSYFWTYISYPASPEKYPRIIRSLVRLREWRSCHAPIFRWQVFFNLSSFLSYQILYTWTFKLAGLHAKGIQNTLDIRVEEETFLIPALPKNFDNFRILFLVDLHLDGLDGLTEKIVDLVRDIRVDLCLVAGDIRMKTYGQTDSCLCQIKKLLPAIRSRNGIFGVLGNHDCIEMTPDLEDAGMVMLINDSWVLTRNGEKIWLVGVDDPHYYRVDDAPMAFRNVPEDGFKILIAHSPEAYESAAAFHPQLYLCGHTHAGQIRLPGRGPILTNSRAPRFTASGRWEYQNMIGYTSRGTGASGVPLRFNCPGEISLITLRKDSRQAISNETSQPS